MLLTVFTSDGARGGGNGESDEIPPPPSPPCTCGKNLELPPPGDFAQQMDQQGRKEGTKQKLEGNEFRSDTLTARSLGGHGGNQDGRAGLHTFFHKLHL